MFGEGSSWLWSASHAVAPGTSGQLPRERGEGQWARGIWPSCSSCRDESSLASPFKEPSLPSSHCPDPMGGSSPYLGAPWGQTLLGQALCPPKSGYMLPPPYPETQGHLFSMFIPRLLCHCLGNSGLRPRPVFFASVCLSSVCALLAF